MPHALSPVSLSLGRQGSGKRYHCICIHNWSQLNASLANLETLWNPLLCHSHNLQCFSSSQMRIEHDCSFGGFGFSFWEDCKKISEKGNTHTNPHMCGNIHGGNELCAYNILNSSLNRS